MKGYVLAGTGNPRVKRPAPLFWGAMQGQERYTATPGKGSRAWCRVGADSRPLGYQETIVRGVFCVLDDDR